MAEGEFFLFPRFGEKRRAHRCALCRETEAPIVGRMNYAALGEWDVVQCVRCGLVSFDPVPDVETIKKGAERLYLIEQASHSRRRFLRFFARSYRRGGHFALHYLRKRELLPERPALLEIGAGNGYFSQGVAKIYPGARVHYLDVMEDLLPYYARHFDCEAVAAEFSADVFAGRTFHLIIARDILEHVRDPLEFLENAHRLLEPNGVLFFITPNGLENFWECSQRFKHSRSATLIWQNHLHFYLPQTLRRLLHTAGFEEDLAFKWGLKHWRAGYGHAEMPHLAPMPIPDLSAAAEAPRPSLKWEHARHEVTGGALHDLGAWSRAYSAVVDRAKERVDFAAPQGREFFVIARKPAPNAPAEAG